MVSVADGLAVAVAAGLPAVEAAAGGGAIIFEARSTYLWRAAASMAQADTASGWGFRAFALAHTLKVAARDAPQVGKPPVPPDPGLWFPAPGSHPTPVC